MHQTETTRRAYQSCPPPEAIIISIGLSSSSSSSTVDTNKQLFLAIFLNSYLNIITTLHMQPLHVGVQNRLRSEHSHAPTAQETAIPSNLHSWWQPGQQCLASTSVAAAPSSTNRTSSPFLDFLISLLPSSHDPAATTSQQHDGSCGSYAGLGRQTRGLRNRGERG